VVTSEPANIQSPKVDGPPCGKQGTSINGVLLTQLNCAAGEPLGPCPKQFHYPQQTKISMAPLPPLPTMPNPCRGVPKNSFCKTS